MNEALDMVKPGHLCELQQEATHVTWYVAMTDEAGVTETFQDGEAR